MLCQRLDFVTRSALVLTLAFTLVNCTAPGASIDGIGGDASADGGTGSVVILAPYRVESVLDFGVQSDGTLLLELNGAFVGAGDQVSVTCLSGAPATASVKSDSVTTIAISLQPLDGGCVFAVQNGSLTSTPSVTINLSATDRAASITQVTDNGHPQTSNTLEKVSLAGTFSGSADSVFAACDGGVFTSVDPSAITADTTSQIQFTMTSPVAFNSCQFFVSDGLVQSPAFTVMAVTSANDNGKDGNSMNTEDVSIGGVFMGTGDTVLVGCDGAAPSAISASAILQESPNEIDFQISAPVNFASCRFAVSDGSVTSLIFPKP